MKTIISFCLFLSVTFASNTFVLNTFDFPPYINKKEGLVLDIVKELFEKSNISYTIKSLPTSRAIRNAQNLNMNIVTPIQRSQEREVKFKWVGPILISQTAIFSLANNNIKIDVLRDIENKEVLVLRGSVEQRYLRDFGIKTQAVKSDLQNVHKLKINRAEIWATDTISASYFSRKTNIDIKKHLIFMTTLRSLAFNINTDEKIIELLNDNLQKMYNDGTIEKILQKYSKYFDTQDMFKFFN